MFNFLCSLESEITNMTILQVESSDRIILNVMILNWFKEYLAVEMGIENICICLWLLK